MEISELQELCKAAFEQREVADRAKKAYTLEYEKLDKIEQTLIAALEENGLKKFDSQFGKVGTRLRFSVKVPQGENREVFFKYLKDKGEFDALITVHSQTLNGWYKQEQEKALSEKKMFFVPGLELPTSSTTLVLTKEK